MRDRRLAWSAGRLRRAAQDLLERGHACAAVCSTTPAVMRTQPAHAGSRGLVADEHAARGQAVDHCRCASPKRASTKFASLGQKRKPEPLERVVEQRLRRRAPGRDTSRSSRRPRARPASAAAAQTLRLYGGTMRRSGASVAGCADQRAGAQRRRGRTPSRTSGRRRGSAAPSTSASPIERRRRRSRRTPRRRSTQRVRRALARCARCRLARNQQAGRIVRVRQEDEPRPRRDGRENARRPETRNPVRAARRPRGRRPRRRSAAYMSNAGTTTTASGTRRRRARAAPRPPRPGCPRRGRWSAAADRRARRARGAAAAVTAS